MFKPTNACVFVFVRQCVDGRPVPGVCVFACVLWVLDCHAQDSCFKDVSVSFCSVSSIKVLPYSSACQTKPESANTGLGAPLTWTERQREGVREARRSVSVSGAM